MLPASFPFHRLFRRQNIQDALKQPCLKDTINASPPLKDNMVHLTNDLAALIGFAGEGTLWGKLCLFSWLAVYIEASEPSHTGAYTILFISSVILLFKGRKSVHLPIPVVAAHVALFVTCTVHYAIEFNHFYTTLVGPVVLTSSTYTE